MDPVASSTGPATAGDRSGAAALVIVVGGALQHQATGAAPAQLPGPVLVVVLEGWPVRVLPAGGPLPARLADGLGLAVDDGRLLLAEGYLAGRAGPGSAGRGRGAAGEVEPSAVGRAGEAAAPTASRQLFRREGEYWTVAYQGAVVRLRDAKGLRHLARLLTQPGREFHAVEPAGEEDRGRPVRSHLMDLPGGRPLPPRRPATRVRPGQAATPRAARCCTPRRGAALHLCRPPARFRSKHERRAGKRLDVTQ
jgi:hypothetical protein